MSPSTPVVAFVWSDDTSAAAIDAMFGRRRPRARRPVSQTIEGFSAFIAARGPQSSTAVMRGSRR